MDVFTIGFGKDGKGVIITDTDVITLLTLANDTALKQDGPLAITEDFRMIKMELGAYLTGTPAADDFPIHLYLVDDELSVGEITEAIVTSGPLDRNDRLAMEQASRPVFYLGSFFPDAIVGVANILVPVLGPKGQKGVIEKTVRWTFSNPEGWAIAAFNQSGGALQSGAIVRLVMKYFGVWLV